MINLEQFTRWDKNHETRIEIRVQEDIDVFLYDSICDFDYKVVATHQHLADMFNVSSVTEEDLLRAKDVAINHGDVVLWIGLDKDERVQFKPHSLSYEGEGTDLGLFIYPRDKWERDSTQPYTEANVLFFFDGWIKEQIGKNLAGELFEADVYQFVGENETCTRGGCYSPEEALREAQAEFPEIIYSADDFDENFKLKV